MATAGKRRQTEYYDQVAVAEYLRRKFPNLLWSCTISGVFLPISVAVKMKRMGLNRGLPDILIFEAGGQYIGLAIEMKVKGNSLTPEQRKMMEKMEELGWKTAVCYGCQEAIDNINAYLLGNSL